MESLYERVSKGTISIDEITESMRMATSEGGKFYQSMEKQSQTLNGQLSTLRDNAMQLLGSMTSGMSEELSSQMLPMVNNMVAELQNAFDHHGFEGLLNTATGMLPDLLGMMTGKLEDAISGLSRWLPQGVDALMKAVPGAIKGASSAIPQITRSLFSVASTVVSDLIGMLPELIPSLIEGIGNMVASTIAGIGSLMNGIYEGVEKAFHQGQEKIMGVWVNSENVAKYDFGIDTNIDVSEAKSKIESAYSEIRTALDAGPLNDEQKKEILSMLGDDAGAIKAKLQEFGLSEPEATALANQISDGGKSIQTAYEELNIGVDWKTVRGWISQANGSKVRLLHLAKMAGLGEQEITELSTFYDTMNGDIEDAVPNIATVIYDKLTDGLADDEETVSNLKDGVQTWYQKKIDEANEGLKADISSLDINDPEYDEKLEAINTKYAAIKSDITAIRDDSLAIIDNLAGQSTESVENAYQTIADIETRVDALEGRLNKVNQKTLSKEQAAFNVVTKGYNTDEATIESAVNLKVTEYNLDLESANDAYDKAMEELNAHAGEMSKEEYNRRQAEITANRDQAIANAQTAYEAAIGAILKGIAMSEGNGEIFDKYGAKALAMQTLNDYLELWDDDSSFDDFGAEHPEIKQGIIDSLATMLEISPEEVESEINFSSIGTVKNYAIQKAFAGLNADGELSGKFGETYAAMLEDGILQGTHLAVENSDEQIAAVIAAGAMPTVTVEPTVSVVPDVHMSEDASGEVQSAMESGVESVISEPSFAPAAVVPVDVQPEISVQTSAAGDESALESAVNEKLEDQTMDVNVQANVSLQVSVSDSNGAEIGRSAGEEIGGALADGISSKQEAASTAAGTIAQGAAAQARKAYTPMHAAGAYAGSGFALGLNSKRASIVNTAESIARDAAKAIREELEINSPSKVTKEYGEFFGEGFQIGLQQSMARAVQVAKQLSGEIVTAADMRSVMQVNVPNLQQEIVVANAQSTTPIQIDGKQIATIQGANNAYALAWRRARMAKGYGY